MTARYGGELKRVVSPAFKASAGTLKVSYTYKGTLTGTGTIVIYELATGNALSGNGMMTAGKASGEATFDVPASGTYIAKTSFPQGSGGGDVVLSQ